ncbi:MAG: sulfotransferase [Myxococcota bacterium]
MGAFRFSDSIDQLHERASAARGLSDFGEDDCRPALEVLCASLDEDASLTPVGEFAFQSMIIDALEARLLVERGWKENPEAAESEIRRPLFIIGLPRTGTTALHHLLSQDPNLQALEHWLQRTPKPRPPRADWNADSDFQAAAARVDLLFERSPEMRAIHEIEAHLPDECWNTFAQNFAHSSYEANADVHSYAKSWAQADMRPTYQRHRRTAQLLGLNEPSKRWLFKDATHLFSPEALLKIYPDAMIVQTHRDPVPVIASVLSLCSSSRAPLNTSFDAKAFGRSTLALWERGIYAMMDERERRAAQLSSERAEKGERAEGQAAPPAKQFYDLSFEQIVSDPLEAIRGIYAHFELEYSESADQNIARYRKENPKGKHGEHNYTLEEWGLDGEEIRERFQRYSDAYLPARR